jgi:hypothetical protein
MDTKPTIKNFLIAILPAILTVFVIFFLIMPKIKENREKNNQISVTNFEECVAAGNPVMESYPRQCRHGEQTFVEDVGQIVGGDKDEYGRIPQGNADLDNFEKQPIENLTTNSFGNDQIEKAITRYLLTEEHFSWRNRNDSHAFCAIENLKPDQELFPLYIWAYCGEYIIQDNELKTISGSSGPAKINYPNELSYYDLSKFSYEAPGDGADYTKDVKKIFPEDVQQKIFNHDARELIKRIENYAFINISNWNSIKQAVADCEIKSIMQTHSLEVSATFKDGKTMTAQEPEIDDIFDIINQYKDKCGEILMGTE